MSRKRSSSRRPAPSKPPNEEATETNSLEALLVTAAYAAVVAYVAFHHELWRDEVRALNIAAGAHSISELFALLRNEGHPPLWYLLLHGAYRITHSMLILKPMSLACAAGAVYLLLRYAPFPKWQRLLFLGGIFPLYQYSVICRNYGISMMLMFAAAALHKSRFSRPLPYCAALLLLANTNAYAFMVAGALLLAFVGEALVTRPCIERSSWVRGSAGLVVVVLGMVAAAIVMLPDATSAVSKLHDRSAGDIVTAFAAGAVAAPFALRSVLTGGNGPLALVVFVVASLYLSTRPWLLLIWLGVSLGFSTFSSLVYGADPFQLGLLFILLLVLLWIDRDSESGRLLPGWLMPRWTMIARSRDLLIGMILAAQVYWGLRAAAMDVRLEISSSESLGRYIESSPELRDAIVIAEPDFLIEALPYYVKNRIYLPREGKDLIKVSLTSARKARLSLDEFLETAARLKNETGKPVLLVMQPPDPRGPYVVKYPYGYTFDYTVDSLELLEWRTISLALFDKAVSDENYVLFKLR